MPSNQVEVSALVLGNLEKVWEFYTQPEHVSQWNTADASWHCTSAINDFREGGNYKARLEAKDGSDGYDVMVTYTKIDPYKIINCDFHDGRPCTTRFENKGDFTQVSLSFEPDPQQGAEKQKQEWEAIFERFKAYSREH